ncbi:MAG: ABC transporter permease [Oribacterium sp.]|jgi:putative ABC transport system permease protein|nr:ABC transporter permease [Oribacterium sp.]
MLLIGSLELGLLYSIMVMGIYISFRILNIPDLTTEGSFTFGLAVSAMLCVIGHPILALPAAIVVGALSGAVTGLLHTRLHIHPVLTGILTMSALYSINTMVLGGTPNLSLIGKDTIFSMLQKAFPSINKEASRTILAVLLVLICFSLLSVFFRTRLGLCIRAVGDNTDMVTASSINVDLTEIIALAISNGLIGLSGGVMAQYQSFADINSGSGILVVGLASVIIGETLTGRHSVTVGFASAVLGSVVYRYIVALATSTSIFPAYWLKMVSSLIVIAALAVPVIKENMAFSKIKKEADSKTELLGEQKPENNASV